jgi:hypothetical protein
MADNPNPRPAIHEFERTYLEKLLLAATAILESAPVASLISDPLEVELGIFKDRVEFLLLLPDPASALAGLDGKPRQAITEAVVLHRDFPAWAVWLPQRGGPWTAVRPASARVPGPDLPMIWTHAATPAELADRMRGVDAQLAAGER